MTGEREKLYWGKVPEKVRRQAVEKAVAGSMPSEKMESEQDVANAMDGGSKRKRRRMK